MNKRGKQVDNTYLSLENAHERGFIHRDYIAHCLRWSHVVKKLTKGKGYSTTRLLDVGCGRELPLASTLYSSRLILEKYYGVDHGPINDDASSKFDSGKFPLELWENQDILDLTLKDLGNERVNVITCFEVLEHVEPAHMRKILQHIGDLAIPGAVFYFSTPCWNRQDCADNHVNEMLFDALGAVFEDAGYKIDGVFGTFASIRDYESYLTTEQANLFNRLREYYDSNVLSCIFAPLFPAQSRNCLWQLSKRYPGEYHDKNRKRRFPRLDDIPTPWGSSDRWAEMKREDESKLEQKWL